MSQRSQSIHRFTALSIALLLGGSLCLNSFASPPSKKHYLRQIDQQLQDLEKRIGGLRARRRSFKGPERERLSSNVRMLEGKLHDARSLRTQLGHPDSDWLKRKKSLDDKVIRLRKSLTYVVNSLR